MMKVFTKEKNDNFMKDNKNKVYICILLISMLVILLISFGITYAILTSTDSKTNSFKVGETKITIDEPGFTPPPALAPGISFNKDPHVKNTGDLRCFVRMMVKFSDSSAEDFCEPLITDPSWLYNPLDGYYYYVGILEPGDSTPPIFTYVEIKSSVDMADLHDFDINVYGESLQCDDGITTAPYTLAEYLTLWGA